MSSTLIQIRQSIKDISPHSISMTLWVTALCSLVLLTLNPSVRYFPHTYEQHILWECLTVGGSTSINCVQVDSLLEAPLLPIFSGILSYIFPPVIAIGILFWFFSLWTFAITWKIASTIGGYRGGICSIVIFLSITIPTDILSLASPKITFTPFIITVLYFLLQTKEQYSIPHFFSIGLLLGLSYLFTTSALPYIISICVIASLIISNRVKVFAFLFGSGILLGIRHLFLSIYTNTLFITARSYIDGILPITFERQIFGEGIYRTSLQSIANSEKDLSMETLMPDINGIGLSSNIEIIMERIPFFLFLCTIAIIRLFFYKKDVTHQLKHLVQSGIVLFLFGIIQSIDANNQHIPLLSLLPFIVVGSLVVGNSLSQFTIPFVKKYSTLLLVAVSAFIAMSSTPQETFHIEQSNPSRNMIEWISRNTNPQESIISTRTNMPLLVLANRKWVQYTSPFDHISHLQNPPRYIIISMQDRWYNGKIKGIGKITSYFFDDNEWYGIFEYSSIKK